MPSPTSVATPCKDPNNFLEMVVVAVVLSSIHSCFLQGKRFTTFRPMTQSRAIEILLKREAEDVPLLPKSPCSEDLRAEIESIENHHLRAALHLLNDDIASCHDIAQANDGDPDFDLLHAILHRREGDFWNSVWWVNRLRSPLLREIHGGKTLADAKARAKTMVDGVERWHRDGQRDGEEVRALRRLQHHELTLLVRHFA